MTDSRRANLLAEIAPPIPRARIHPSHAGMEFSYGSTTGDEILRDLGDLSISASRQGHVLTAETLTGAICWIQKLTGCHER